MIIRLQRHQPELRLRHGRPGGLGGPLDARDLRLVIRPPAQTGGCGFTDIVRKGFWPGNPPENDSHLPHELPALTYPCFEIDEEGDAVFRFDRLLWRRPCGRYVGHVNYGPKEIARVDLDLGPIDWRVLRADVRHAIRRD
jgi:hypothetical protein